MPPLVLRQFGTSCAMESAKVAKTFYALSKKSQIPSLRAPVGSGGWFLE